MDEYLILAIILFAVTLTAVGTVTLVVLVGLPDDYLCASRPAPSHAPRSLLDTTGRVLKNVFGSVLVVVGVILAVPLVPGPGVLIAAAGLLLLDFPGKPRMLRKVLCKPAVLRPINRLRQVFARAPLIVD